MPLAALLLLVSGTQPSPGIAAAFHGELGLTLAALDYPAPPSAAPLSIPPVPMRPAAPPPGSTSAAFWESAGLNLLSTGVLDTVSLLSLAEGSLAISPPCGGKPNLTAGIPLVALGIVAFLAQPFLVAATTRWLYELQGYHVGYWTAFGADLLSTLVAGPLLGLLVGAGASAVGGSSAGTAAAVAGLATYGMVSAVGAPISASIVATPFR
ncbi:MAG: hypothetical protein ACYDCL_02565 [Myxococcales bacterium]